MATTKKTDNKTEEKNKPKAVKKPAAKRPAKKVAEKKAVEADKEVVVESAEIAAAEAVKSGSFIPALGRRKTSIARVRLIKNGKGLITVNGKKMDTYFTTYELREDVMSPLKAVGQVDTVDISARVTGGGIRGQAQAIRLGISRALIILNPTFRTALKKLGYMTRDPRKRQRKMFGKKSARRSPQWSKR
ncbi:MAG: 30S ribosomal protein S9 [Patescibacteria group bacterium]